MAGVAPRLGLATGILVLPQGQAVLAAKQAAELDLLSAGRRLGLGISWNIVKFEAPWRRTAHFSCYALL
jgi:alkanesulfonate monooxygenase SsuD/methylene tetrahydromethanopterin reductase-like flavin-dependent oxidoreductase (luciferase family)